MPNLTYGSEAEWLALRDTHVGGSDIASLFNIWQHPETGDEHILHAYERPPEGVEFIECLSPYTSSYRLWLEKAGRLKPDFKETERVTAGKFLEPALAAWAMSKWGGEGFKLRKTRRYIEHDEVPGWGASFDYEVVEPGYPPVEFKNVDWLIFRDKWKMAGADDITPPFHINLQLQCQIGLTKAEYGWIVICVGGNELHRVKVPRHEPTIARINEAITLFWQGVKVEAEPTWLAEYDFDTVKEVVRFGDKRNPPVDLSADADVCRDLRRFRRWKDHLDFVDGHLARIKARIGMRIGDATRLLGDTHELSWPVVVRPAKLIPEKWQDEATWRGGFTVKERK